MVHLYTASVAILIKQSNMLINVKWKYLKLLKLNSSWTGNHCEGFLRKHVLKIKAILSYEIENWGRGCFNMKKLKDPYPFWKE